MKLGVITDVHLAQLPRTRASWHNDFDYPGAAWRLGRSLQLMAGLGVDSVAVLGDLTEDGDRASLEEALAALAATGLPTMIVPGNHDCDARVEALAVAVGQAGGGLAMAGPTVHRVAGASVSGVLLARPPAGRGFAPADLPELSAELVLLSHYPVLSRREAVTGAGYKYAGDLVGRESLAAHVQADGAAVVALSGHLHVRDATASGRLLQLSLPAMIEPPYTCAVVEVGGDPLAVSYRTIPIEPTPDGLDVPLFAPEHGTWVLGPEGWAPADAAGSRD